MRTTSPRTDRLITGTFLYEIKNRFLCMVKVGTEDVVCYIPSSCRLSNFLDLKNRQVLLSPVASKTARTLYSVFAVKFKRSYILLNTSLPNTVIEEEIASRRFAFLGKRNQVLREKKLREYRCDLFIQDTNTIIEIKSIISTNNEAYFPTVYSERAINQLRQIIQFLKSGYHVTYIFASLNPYVKRLCINDLHPYKDLFRECVSLGMKLKCVTLRIKGDAVCINSIFDI